MEVSETPTTRRTRVTLPVLVAGVLLLSCSSGTEPSPAPLTASEDAGDASEDAGVVSEDAGDERARSNMASLFGGPEDAPTQIRLIGGAEGVPVFKALDGPPASKDPWDRSRRGRLESFEATERVGFVPFASFDVIADSRVAADSRKWMDVFLTSEASPYRAGARVQRSLHRATSRTDDVIRHKLTFEVEDAPDRPNVKIALRVLESLHTVLIIVDTAEGKNVLGVPPAERAAVLSWITKKVLRRTGTYVKRIGGWEGVEYAWTFLHDSLEEGSWFSTDTTKDPRRMLLWALRVDGGIRKGRVFFMAYKKPELINGRQSFTLDGAHWFDGKAWKRFETHEKLPGLE